MKKLLALLLLHIHLFSIGGQLTLHQYMVYKSDRLFDEQISKNLYNIKDLTEVKIPVNMPGISDWKDYENVSGQIQFEKNSYNYVKIKITRHVMYLMCIPNYKTTHLSGKNIIDAKPITDVPVSKKDHVPFGKINLVVYNYQDIHYSFIIPVLTFRDNSRDNNPHTSNKVILGPGQPPDLQPLLS